MNYQHSRTLHLQSTPVLGAQLIVCALLLGFGFPDSAHAQAQAPWQYAYNAPQFANGAIRSVICDIYFLMEGELGALILAASGFMAICSAALGDFKNAKAAVMTACGAGTVAVGVSLYFGDFGCGTQQAGAQQAQGAGAQAGGAGAGGGGAVPFDDNLAGPPDPFDIGNF